MVKEKNIDKQKYIGRFGTWILRIENMNFGSAHLEVRIRIKKKCLILLNENNLYIIHVTL